MSPALTRVTVLPAAQAEIVALDDQDVKYAVVTALVEIERNLEYGVALGVGPSGDLRGCRKVYVDKPTDSKPRYRLVYWCAPSEARPRRARVLAFGERRSLDAYDRAASRYNTDRHSQGRPAVESQTDQELGLQQ